MTRTNTGGLVGLAAPPAAWAGSRSPSSRTTAQIARGPPDHQRHEPPLARRPARLLSVKRTDTAQQQRRPK
jgi:hypothetical protein